VGFRRFLGLDRPADGRLPAGDRDAPAPTSAPGETATVRRIVARLEALPPEQARYLAGFAYVLSRAAHADFDVSEAETRLMERFVVEYGGLDDAQAVIVVQVAKVQSKLHGGTEDFVVTREFSKLATPEQKLALLRCCFAIGAADDSITAEEASEVNQIARELDVDRDALNAIRAEFHDKLSVIRQMRRSLEA
jgi:uncharacterized tellurite resistance protein B-like protein